MRGTGTGAQRSCGHPIPGSIWGLEGTEHSFPTQTIVCLPSFGNTAGAQHSAPSLSWATDRAVMQCCHSSPKHWNAHQSLLTHPVTLSSSCAFLTLLTDVSASHVPSLSWILQSQLPWIIHLHQWSATVCQDTVSQQKPRQNPKFQAPPPAGFEP